MHCLPHMGTEVGRHDSVSGKFSLSVVRSRLRQPNLPCDRVKWFAVCLRARDFVGGKRCARFDWIGDWFSSYGWKKWTPRAEILAEIELVAYSCCVFIPGGSGPPYVFPSLAALFVDK